MKHTVIYFAFLVILVSASMGAAQVSSVRVTFSESTDAASGMGMGKVTVQDTLYDPDLDVFEVLIRASSPEQCFASTDFSRARPVGPDRASLSYDFSTSTYELKIIIGQLDRDNCRVILVGETPATARYNVWRANFGRTSFAEAGLISGEQSAARSADGSVRFISYQVGVTGW